ncbi:MAG TPA: glutathione S-transferase N-terminal domain-containing protein [Polyangiaceae bacterium]|nr:glutathione S-transferase N-terminal domain-containing protein [Polyangiaceae bacterium]
MVELLGLVYSPWTEKARFALDARRVRFRFRGYTPLLGEPGLRLKTRRPTGTVTVPVLTRDDGEVLADSLAIARWADTQGAGPRLFPPEREAEVVKFVDLSERALAAGRGLSLLRMLDDGEALKEMVPKALRRPLGPVATALGRAGVKRTLAKYGVRSASRAPHEAELGRCLDALREALAAAPPADGSGRPRTLLGELTFADIAMAQALAFVEPPAFGLRLGRAARRSFTDPALSARYADLVTWRDALYEAHRPR